MINTKYSPWPSYTDEEAHAVRNVLLSNKVNYWTGTECHQFEKKFAAWSGTQFAIALMNGTVALDVALKALEICSGDEVIVTSRTFLASVSSIVNSGAVPVFADVSPDSQNITPHSVRDKITSKTKAIMCVHLAGWPCDMDEIMSLADEFGLYVIEDCAQAHGAKYKGIPVGSIGHIGAWSFCQDKIMTTGGEGGMVTTNDHSLWSIMWSYKDHGKSWEAVYEREHPPGYRWLHDTFGTNLRMTEMQAAIGNIQVSKMPEWHRLRTRNANILKKRLSEIKFLRIPDVPEYMEHAWYRFYAFIKPEMLKSNWDRNRVMQELNNNHIPCTVGSCPEIYRETAFVKLGMGLSKSLPVAYELGETSLAFLVHPTLSSEEMNDMADTIVNVLQDASK